MFVTDGAPSSTQDYPPGKTYPFRVASTPVKPDHLVLRLVPSTAEALADETTPR